jgi:uncharacterized protein Yka (UPF0111/DUF47 family)
VTDVRRWFLPETPDVIGMLRAQVATTEEGLAAFARWSAGEAEAADRVRACEHRADAQKRELRRVLTTAFLTPLEPEDLFELSSGVDTVLNGVKDAVREAEVMGVAADAAMAGMAELLVAGMQRLATAFALLEGGRHDEATAAADQAVKGQRDLEHVYRAAMSALLADADPHTVAARRELYRRISRTSDELTHVAERVWYAVLKDS